MYVFHLSKYELHCKNQSILAHDLTEFIHIQENVNDADKYMLVELLNYKSIMPHKLRKYI